MINRIIHQLHRLIFCEYYLFESDAERREMYLKTTAGRKGLN